ncbi:MAG: hypothetical protein KGR26_05635 [Cyanobacteria bacterium REEB65]|nr:hypothetical protein [Cyanobacteria bacterium REEB65]
MSGKLIHASRKLKPLERNFLLKRVGLAAAGLAGLMVPLGGLLTWAILAKDAGSSYLFVLLLIPALVVGRRLWRWSTPYRRDLFANRVESVIGRVGEFGKGRGIIPIYIGDQVFGVRSDLLETKKVDQPILIEFIRNCSLAVAIDGQSNLDETSDLLVRSQKAT